MTLTMEYSHQKDISNLITFLDLIPFIRNIGDSNLKEANRQIQNVGYSSRTTNSDTTASIKKRERIARLKRLERYKINFK